MPHKRTAAPVHPGRLLAVKFMRPSGVTQYRLAKDTGLSPIQVSHIVRGKRAITVETAMRLGRFFRMPPEFWLHAQTHYDLLMGKKRMAKRIKREVTPLDDRRT
ncbi:MAG TPA: HigA family addiction module antitoxin [Alphaproteobacteria bacterium]|nr:HigA family addiction module antitoxin [Alphaproteobacteria bacterium]